MASVTSRQEADRGARSRSSNARRSPRSTRSRVWTSANTKRRNLVTEGVPLNHLVGRTFRVGTVVLYGCRLADPCAYLAALSQKPGLARALANRAGLRADILVGGLLHVGDMIVEVEAAEIDVPG